MHSKNCVVESSEYQKLWTRIFWYIYNYIYILNTWWADSEPMDLFHCGPPVFLIEKWPNSGGFGGIWPCHSQTSGYCCSWYTYPSEKYWSVGMIIPNIWQNKKCSKPPTSIAVGKFVSLIFSAIEPPFISGIFHCHVWEHRRVASSFGTDFRFTPKGLLHCDKEVS